jgi:hypothetical protein
MTTLETLSIYDDMIENLRSQKCKEIENYIIQFYEKLESIKMQFNDLVFTSEGNAYNCYASLQDSTKEHIFYFNVAEVFINDRHSDNDEYESITITHIHDSEVMSKEEQKFTFSFDLQTDVLQFQKIVFNYMTNLMIEQLI